MTSAIDVDNAIPIRRRLTPFQRSLLAFQLNRPKSPALNMALLVEFASPLEVEVLSSAFDDVVRDSDALRTQVSTDPGIVQISTQPTAKGRVIESVADLDGWVREQVKRPFELSEGCYRSTIVSDNGLASAWLIEIHHLVTDATSSTLVVEETLSRSIGKQAALTRFYNAFNDADTSTGDLTRSTIPMRAISDDSGAAARVDMNINPSTIEQLQTGPLRLLTPDLTMTAALTTAAAIEIGRSASDQTARIGIPIHHRSGPERQHTIGPVMNMADVEITVDPHETVLELHRRVTRALLDALRANRPVGPPGLRHQAVINVIARATPSVPSEIDAECSWIPTGAIDPAHQFRVQASNYGNAGTLSLSMDVLASDRSDRSERFARCLRTLIKDPSVPVCTIDAISAQTVAQLVEHESSQSLPTSEQRLVERIRRALAESDDIAVTQGATELTGRELWKWIERCAGWVASETSGNARVAVELPRSVEALVLIFGTLRAGRSFVPIDPSQPTRRRDSLCERAGVELRVSAREPILDSRRNKNLVPPDLRSDDSSEAYLLFTSGSTGEPKGVPIKLGALDLYLQFAAASYFEGATRPVAPLYSPLTFDLTITTLFAPLLLGGSLVIFERDGAQALREVADTPHLTWCKATPSHLEILLRLGMVSSLRHLVVGGEAFTSSLARKLQIDQPDATIFNEYGPTEAVVGCMIYQLPDRIQGDGPLPIGRPAPGVSLRVVDQLDARVDFDEHGELLIAHPGLTDGYLSGDTSRFVEVDNTRYYRSGDVVARDKAGLLTYFGRTDEEVKVGGIRLSPVEVQQELNLHVDVERSAVRIWTPAERTIAHHCNRCGLPDNVPDVRFDASGVCDRCHAFDEIREETEAWFGSERDLAAIANGLRSRRTGNYDCVFLLSGGKDSTWGLYKLIELGFQPMAVTYDNGFISEGAKLNIERSVAHLGIDHEYLVSSSTVPILRDSLTQFSDVCHGCYKALYTLATNKAVDIGAAAVITGLSRGQLFETRLVPGQFEHDRFDPSAIDAAVLSARMRYHRAPDLANRLLDTSIFQDDELFEAVQFIDLYRYIDVELDTVLTDLAEGTPWIRPADTGRSSNCLVNVAGIRAHQIERGYHNYAEPYAWDVRLGHKTRDEAIAELDDPIDDDEIAALFAQLGYEPKPPELLTAWFEVRDGSRVPTPAELRQYLSERLPAWAVPSAFVHVTSLPINTNGKVDTAALPPPQRTSRAASGAVVQPESQTERLVIDQWQRILEIEPLGVHDDFFALGGDSLGAISSVLSLSRALGLALPEELAFTNTTARQLGTAIDTGAFGEEKLTDGDARVSSLGPTRVDRTQPPEIAIAEQSLLYEQQLRPTGQMFNVAQVLCFDRAIDPERLSQAIRQAASAHDAFKWSFGQPRVRLEPEAAIEIETGLRLSGQDELDRSVERFRSHSYDLEHGPLLRCRIAELDEATTVVMIGAHHVSIDHQSIDVLWEDATDLYFDRVVPEPLMSLSELREVQREAEPASLAHWQQVEWGPHPHFEPVQVGVDGITRRRSSVAKQDLTRRAGKPPATTVVAAAAIAAQPYFDDTRVQLGLVTTTRTHPDSQRLVGYLLNPLPIQIDFSNAATAADIAETTNAELGRNLVHRATPFATITDAARAADAEPPSAAILVSYIDDPLLDFDGHAVRRTALAPPNSVADITFFVETGENQLDLMIEYRGSALSHEEAAALLERFENALRLVVYSEHGQLCALEATQPSWLKGKPIAERTLILTKILDHAHDGPDEPAVVTDSVEITRHELVTRAGTVTRSLIEAGIGPGDRVCVAVHRTELLPIVMLGVLLAGATYVPIDPTHPLQRVRAMIDTADPALLVVEPDSPSWSTQVPTMAVARNGINGSWESATPVAVDIEPDTPAYVIFTSGSTGAPRGVSVTHQQLALSTNSRNQFYEDRPSQFAMLSSQSFDSSIVGLFWPLSVGGTLLIPPADVASDPDPLVKFLDRHRPSHMLCVPTMYAMLLERMGPGQELANHVIVAGERCTAALISRHSERFSSIPLTNEYGPTEGTVWATARRAESGTGIGTPIPGMVAAICGPNLDVLEEGMIGELIIGGPQVVTGYLDGSAPGKFGVGSSEGPFPEGMPFFRTGDRVVQRSGELQFLGRLDDQLSIAGVRIEPGEIEHILESAEGVATARVTATDLRPLEQLLRTSPQEHVSAALRSASDSEAPERLLRELLGDEGASQIVAHIEGDATPESLHRWAAEKLPIGRRPAHFVIYDNFPRLPNGKVDQRQLAAALPTPATIAEAQGGDITVAVQRLFADVLGSGIIESHTNFFDAGGDSLRGFELIRRAEKEFGNRLPMRLLHDAPTPQLFARGLSIMGNKNPLADDRILSINFNVGAEGPAVVMLHHVGVNGRFAKALADELDLPVSAMFDRTSVVSPRGEMSDDARVIDISETVQLYCDAIVAEFGDRPIVLVGHCQGGIFAHEVAVELMDRGHTPAGVVVVFDWHAPGMKPPSGLSGYLSAVRRESVRGVTELRLRGAVRKLKARLNPNTPAAEHFRIATATNDAFHSHSYSHYRGRVLIVRRCEDEPHLGMETPTGWNDEVEELVFDCVSGAPFAGSGVQHLAELIHQESQHRAQADSPAHSGQ